MDFLNRLKSFLGFQTTESNHELNRDRPVSRSNVVSDDVVVRDRPPDEYERFGFNVFSNPLEMHRYFEHQMNEMMKNFGMFGHHSFSENDPFFGSSDFGGVGEPFFGENQFGDEFKQFPAIEDFRQDQQQGSLREQYLRPGYEQARPHEENKSDGDVDGKFDMGDLNTVLRGRSSQSPRTYFFGQSVTSKTIRNADGTVETRRTVKDQHGNEETTISRKQGDKEYSVTTRTDKDGQQEVIENLVNMDENDKDAFLKDNKPYKKLIDENEKTSPNWFPFDKFFK